MLKNKNPAEIARGLVADFDFSSATNIALQGGVITGALEYKNKGAYFDGTNDYITYGAGKQLFNTGIWSMVFEFTPNFASNSDTTHYFMMGSEGTYIAKMNNAGSNKLRFTFGGTVVYWLDEVVYAPYWKANQRNVLVVSTRSGGTKAYLNGTLIVNETTAYSASTLANFYIGATSGGGSKFLGTMHSMKFFKHTVAGDLLTAQEALDYYTGQTFNYEKRATCILPMTADCHDATNNRTLDAS